MRFVKGFKFVSILGFTAFKKFKPQKIQEDKRHVNQEVWSRYVVGGFGDRIGSRRSVRSGNRSRLKTPMTPCSLKSAILVDVRTGRGSDYRREPCPRNKTAFPLRISSPWNVYVGTSRVPNPAFEAMLDRTFGNFKDHNR